MKYIKTYESYEDDILFDRQKVSQKVKDTLKYKEGDVVLIESFYEEESIVEIIFIRKGAPNDMANKFIYGVVKLDSDKPKINYIEIPESYIIRKLDPSEVSAIKYNL